MSQDIAAVRMKCQQNSVGIADFAEGGGSQVLGLRFWVLGSRSVMQDSLLSCTGHKSCLLTPNT
jgi:hypothetical protein